MEALVGAVTVPTLDLVGAGVTRGAEVIKVRTPPAVDSALGDDCVDSAAPGVV